jgi:uncharacterized cupin superfamily protein
LSGDSGSSVPAFSRAESLERVNCQDAGVRRFNVFAPELDESSERDGYRWRAAQVGQSVGAEEIAARLYELEDGQRSAPYHFHRGIEEWLIVVDGAPRVRTPQGERALERGDVVSFPVGPEGAHEVTGPGRVLLLSTIREPEVVEYPESGKLELRPTGEVFRRADAVDLWEGE